MPNAQYQARLRRKCAAALSKAVDRFPQLLAEAETEEAARIVAGLIKAQLDLPEPESDPADALEEVLKRARAETLRSNP
jgi:hypothetical protein